MPAGQTFSLRGSAYHATHYDTALELRRGSAQATKHMAPGNPMEHHSPAKFTGLLTAGGRRIVHGE